jgi:transposase
MRDTDLFRMALGIEPPWLVKTSEFDAAAKRLDIHLDFARGSRFFCPECGVADCPAYDSEDKIWRHLNFFQHEAYLHARVPRVTCKRCGIKQVTVPWARPDSGFTLLFEALIMAMVQAMPVAVVARMIDEWTPDCGGSSTTTSRRLGTAPITPRSAAWPLTKRRRGAATTM